MIANTVIEATHPDAVHLKIVDPAGKEIELVTAIDLGTPRRVRVMEPVDIVAPMEPAENHREWWVERPFTVLDKRTGKEWLG